MRSSGRPSSASLISAAYVRGSSFGIVAAVDRALAHAGIAEVGEVGVVELDVAATGRVEGGDLVAVHLGEVVEEAVEVGVRLDADARPGRRGNGPSWATGWRPWAGSRRACWRPRTGSRRPGSGARGSACR